jgi:putative chitinase
MRSPHLVVECDGFTRLEEDLNYSAQRLMAVWPRRFPTLASALPCAHNPQVLANKVYGGRGGNTEVGDGWRFRGMGPIGRTFRSGYGEASANTGEDLVTNPALIKRPDIGALDAAAFWQAHGLNQIADEDAGEAAMEAGARTLAERVRLCLEDDLEAETQRVNGGLTGLDARRNALIAAMAAWGC